MFSRRRPSTVRERRWSKKEYYRLEKCGFFLEQRVELLGGRIVVQPRQSPPHAATVGCVADILRSRFGRAPHVRQKVPLDLGKWDEPEPDVYVALGKLGDYAEAHPTQALLIIEVSDGTLEYDRRRKGSLYARAGIQDYWIINVPEHQVEIYRVPVPDVTQLYGHRYSSRVDLTPPATVSPLALPNAAIPVADLLL